MLMNLEESGRNIYLLTYLNTDTRIQHFIVIDAEIKFPKQCLALTIKCHNTINKILYCNNVHVSI